MEQLPNKSDGRPGEIIFTPGEQRESELPPSVSVTELLGYIANAHGLAIEAREETTSYGGRRGEMRKHLESLDKKKEIATKMQAYMPKYSPGVFNAAFFAEPNEQPFLTDEETNEFLSSLEKNNETL